MANKLKANKLPSGIIAGALLTLFFGIALYLRAYLPHDHVFVGDWIKFTSIDAYYQMFLVDNIAHNFPHTTTFTPYLIYPGGSNLGGIHFFNWLLAGIIWVVSLGSPTEHTVDVIGVYFPAVLGALTVIPVYFIGKELFNRWAGVISAGLIVLLPGEFLGRSMLGFTDYHIFETLLTTVTILFLILALKTARQRQLTLDHLKSRDWATSAKPLIYSLFTGVFLGLYLITWSGALLFVFIISVYFIIQFIIDHLRGNSTDYLCVVGIILFLIALIIFLPGSPETLYSIPMVMALLIPPALYGISRLMAAKNIKAAYYPLSLVGLGLVTSAVLYIISPSLSSAMLRLFTVFIPSGVQLTTIEMQPILFPRGDFSLSVVWGNFTTSFFLSLISLGILTYFAIKQHNPEKSLLVVWSLVILAATLGQRRFAYYFAVNAAVLTGYLSWQFLQLAGFRDRTSKPAEIPQEAYRRETRLKAKRQSGFHITSRQVTMALAVLVIFFMVFFPNIGKAKDTATAAPFAPSDAWYSSLSWLKENTPEPFGDPDFYYHLETSKEYRPFKYPESAYGVLAWWDYGYWIARIAHRLPNANPGQEPGAVARVAGFFTSQDEESASKIAQEMGTSYVIIDNETATSKFWAIALWAGQERAVFFDTYYVQQEGKVMPVNLFYPEYYRSMSTRLYNFDGKAVTPDRVLVISHEEKAGGGEVIKQITSVLSFSSYQEAAAYIASQQSANYKIVSDNPYVSPVPLEALEHYKLVHGSDVHIRLADGNTLPAVKIFEYIE